MKTILVDAVHTLVSADGIVNTKLFNLLEAFPNNKIILTNANDEQMLKQGFEKLPYKVFSLKHNPDKSEVSYYKIMFKTLELKAEETIYFDHNIIAVNNAQKVGIKSMLYVDDSSSLINLERFIKQNL